MSYPFECGDRTVWDAGYHSGQLYASLVQGAAAFLDVPSGLTPTPSGGCEVDPSALLRFTDRLYDLYASTNNEVLLSLAHGPLITSLVLVDRTGGRIALRPEHEVTLGQEKSAFARSMA
ncbi:DUF6086 family protein [Streptomyces sp. NPDC049687]|uniref:DUF6086 family protein n=1 Tax=Streptomyces sp. NPDC049687 TaxID=3365596 RepID=UPI0037B39672